MIWTKLVSVFQMIVDPKNRTFLLLAVVMALSTLTFQQCNKVDSLQQEVQVKDSNLKALADTLSHHTTETGRLVAEKGALQVTVEELQTLNSDLSQRINKDDPPITVTNLGYTIVRDTVEVSDVNVESDGLNHLINFRHTEIEDWGSRAISGFTKFAIEDGTITNPSTTITEDFLDMSLSTGFRERDDGMIVTYVETDAPDVHFSVVEGAVLDPSQFYKPPQQKRWGLGPVLGAGFDSSMSSTFFIGIGLQYQILQH